VKLVVIGPPQRTRRIMYVRSNENATLAGIAPGSYLLRYELGRSWNPGTKHFSNEPVFSQFDRTLYYEQEESGGYTVTLHAVQGGNALTKRISLESFDAGDEEWQ